MKKIVISIDKCAFSKRIDEQLNLFSDIAKSVVSLVSIGYNVAIVCDSSGQNETINHIFEDKDHSSLSLYDCEAMCEGYIGYYLEQAIRNELISRNIERNCISILTQIEVPKKDKEYDKPTFSYGKYYSELESKKISKKTNYRFKEEMKKGFRRLVPSPEPMKIVQMDIIKKLFDDNNIVIMTCGIPVIKYRNAYRGINVIINNDKTSYLLAKGLDADSLLLLSNFEKLSLNTNSLDQINLSKLDITEAKEYLANNAFDDEINSKVESCISFCEKNANKTGIITSLYSLYEAVINETGTIIKDYCKELEVNRTKKITIIEIIVIVILDILLLSFILLF